MFIAESLILGKFESFWAFLDKFLVILIFPLIITNGPLTLSKQSKKSDMWTPQKPWFRTNLYLLENIQVFFEKRAATFHWWWYFDLPKKTDCLIWDNPDFSSNKVHTKTITSNQPHKCFWSNAISEKNIRNRFWENGKEVDIELKMTNLLYFRHDKKFP